MVKGKQFEKAVYEFVQKLAPDAHVIFDHKVRDKDTGKLRQVDVWIDTKVANHFPLSILISCKDYKRKINVSDIGTFVNEVQCTGASTGIIYSRSGFTKPAVKKAAANGLTCCRLYKEEPADIPAVLIFHDYISKPQCRFDYVDSRELPPITTWGDLYDLKLPDGRTTVYEVLEETYKDIERKFLAERKHNSGLPKGQISDIDILLAGGPWLRMRVHLGYRHFRGRVEAQLVLY